MEIIETTTLSEITVLPQEGNVQVKWVNTLEREGVVLNTNHHYKLYSQAQAADFLAEVEGAAGYIAVLGW